MGEVIGAEAEELRGLGNFIGGDGAARHFDHGSDEVIEFDACFCHDFLGDAVNDFDLEVEFFFESDERDHDLWFDGDVLFGDGSGRLEDGAGLHLGDLWVGDAEAATAVAEHRVELVEVTNALGDHIGADAEFLRECILRGVVVRQKLVQRWVEQADGGGQAVECLEDADEILTLVRQEFGQGGFAVIGFLGDDHFAHGIDAVALEEHVLCAAEADADCAEGDGIFDLFRVVSIGADVELGDF